MRRHCLNWKVPDEGIQLMGPGTDRTKKKQENNILIGLWAKIKLFFGEIHPHTETEIPFSLLEVNEGVDHWAGKNLQSILQAAQKEGRINNTNVKEDKNIEPSRGD